MGSLTVGRSFSRRPMPGAGGQAINVVSLAAGALFVVAGWLTVTASNLRWGGVCSASWDDRACEVIQDHRYDYLAPIEPAAPAGGVVPEAAWVPIPGTSQLAGVGMLVLAIALVLAFAMFRATVGMRCGQALCVLAVATLGAITMAAGSLGRPLTGFNPVIIVAFGIWALLGPLVIIFSALGAVTDRRGRGALASRAWGVWAGTLAASTPLLGLVLAGVFSFGYVAYDSIPWEEGLTGVFYALAGVSIIAGVVLKALRPGSMSPAPRRGLLAPHA